MTLVGNFLFLQARRQLHRYRGDFYFDLSMSLEDRVPLFTTLKKYEARARRRSPRQAALFRHMVQKVQHGSLAEAMRGVATPMELVILDAIQTGGDDSLGAGLAFLADSVEKSDKMLGAIRRAVTYPIFLLLVFGLLLTGFALFAVPVLAALLPPQDWPPMGKILYFVSHVIRNYGVVLLALVIGLFATFFWSLENWTGKWRRRLDRHVPYSLYRDYQGALLLLAIASLLKSKVSLRASVERCLRFSSPWLRWHLYEVLKRLSGRDSANFGAAFQTGLLSQSLEDRVQDAAERRDPITAFVRIGLGSVDRTANGLTQSAAILNGVMVAICGFVLGFMMLAFFATSFEMQNSIRNSSVSSTSGLN